MSCLLCLPSPKHQPWRPGGSAFQLRVVVVSGALEDMSENDRHSISEFHL